MKRSGFTLIETIGVIIVIALIATITIPIVVNSNDRNRIIEQERADVKAALEYYFDAHPEIKQELRINGYVIINSSSLENEGYIHNISKKQYKVIYNEDGTYDLIDY